MSDSESDAKLVDVQLGSFCTVLLGAESGKYPDANGLLVRGTERTALIDPTLGVAARRGRLPKVDLVLLTHCHEDHIPGLADYPDAECWVHQADRYGLESIDRFMDLFGLPEPRRSQLKASCLDKFNYVSRPDAIGFEGGQQWDLGDVSIKAIHAPGHTAGHCLFLVEPDDVLFLGDIDLSSFGPFYGDTDSSVDDFEKSIATAKSIRAKHYISGHHKGIVDAIEFPQLIEKYGRVINRRDERLLEFLGKPRSLDEIVAHRFIYRPQDKVAGADWVERVSMGMHLRRLARDGRIEQAENGQFVARP